MCGRYATTMSRVDIQLESPLDVVAESTTRTQLERGTRRGHPNCPRTQGLPGDQWPHYSPCRARSCRFARQGPHRARPDPAMWGLIPPWAKDASLPMINARMESGREAPVRAGGEDAALYHTGVWIFEGASDKTPFYIYRWAPARFLPACTAVKNGKEWVLTAIDHHAGSRGRDGHDYDRAHPEPTEYDAAWTLRLRPRRSPPRPDLASASTMSTRQWATSGTTRPKNIVSITYTPQV